MRPTPITPHPHPPGSWRFRVWRVFRLPLGNGGALKAALWASGLFAAAVVCTYLSAWALCLAAPNQSEATTAWSQGPLKAVRVDGGTGEPGVERIWWSDTYGWPFRSVGALSSQTNSAARGEGRITLQAGIDLGATRDLNQRGLTIPWALPLVPVNGLFVLNVAFYFVLCGLLALGWAVRRDRRLFTGQRCIQCAYPLDSGGACPECGYGRSVR